MGCTTTKPINYVPLDDEHVIYLLEEDGFFGKNIEYNEFIAAYKDVPEDCHLTIIIDVCKIRDYNRLDKFLKIAYVIAHHITLVKRHR